MIDFSNSGSGENLPYLKYSIIFRYNPDRFPVPVRVVFLVGLDYPNPGLRSQTKRIPRFRLSIPRSGQLLADQTVAPPVRASIRALEIVTKRIDMGDQK